MITITAIILGAFAPIVIIFALISKNHHLQDRISLLNQTANPFPIDTRCPSCNAWFAEDQNQKIIMCPWCGHIYWPPHPVFNTPRI